MVFCQVANCRYPSSHVTSDHICGKCNKKGHGQIECNNPKLKSKLEKYKYNELPIQLQCKASNCKRYKFHTTKAHVCKICNEFHSEYRCQYLTIESFNNYKSFLDQTIYDSQTIYKYKLINKNQWIIPNDCINLIEKILSKYYLSQIKIKNRNIIEHIYCNLNPNSFDQSYDYISMIIRKKDFLIENNINKNDQNYYLCFLLGMGCSIYARINKLTDPIEYFFLHSDCMGQYGNNHLPFLDNFCKDYHKKFDEPIIPNNYM